MSTVIPNSGNMYFGSGIVSLDRWLGSPLAKTTAFFDAGSVESFKTNMSVDMEVARTARTGARAPYAAAPKQTDGTFEAEFSEVNFRNLALSVLGTATPFTQSAATKTDVAIANVNGGVQLDADYFIGYTGVTVFTAKKASTALVAGTDYTFNAETGAVRFLSTGSTVTAADTTVTWSGTVPAVLAAANRSIIQLLSNANIVVSARFNSATDAVGQRYSAMVPKIQLAPSKEFDWLKQGFETITMKGTLLPDSTNTFNGTAYPYGYWLEL